jgi:tRNA 2-thiouridine synthesizing protein A
MFVNDTEELDLTGLKCPMPIVELNKQIKGLADGEQFVASADDPAFCLDVEAWCSKTGHELLELKNDAETLVAVIRKCGK